MPVLHLHLIREAEEYFRVLYGSRRGPLLREQDAFLAGVLCAHKAAMPERWMEAIRGGYSILHLAPLQSGE